MSTLFHSLFHPLSNAITSGLMIASLAYWVFSFLGIGLDDLDLDLDVGTGTPADIQADTDIDIDTEGEIPQKQESAFVSFLKFINVGKVPFMFVSSILNFIMWAGSLLATTLTTIGNWGWKSVFILIPLFIIAIFLTKYATNPIARFLKKTGYHGEDATDFLGRSGKMVSSIEEEKLGSAEFIIDQNPIKLNVISHSGEKLSYGDTVLITDESADKKIFYVTNQKDYHPSKLKFKL